MTAKKKISSSFAVSSSSVLSNLISSDMTEKPAVSKLSLAVIVLNPEQPRRYFDQSAMEKLVQSIQKNGILQPLLVRPKEASQYELVAGERRYRAAQQAGLEEIPVIVRDLTDEEATEIALMENLQREDLNPVEETEGILALLTAKLNKSRADVISLFNQASHPQYETAKIVLRSPEWQIIKDIFTVLGRLSPDSFRTTRLILLNLPEDVLNALREGKIQYTKAIQIAKLKNDKQRRKFLTEAIEKKLTLSQIKEQIKLLKSKTNKQQPKEAPQLKTRLTTAYKRMNQAKFWQSSFLKDPQSVSEFEAILNQLEAFLEKAD